MARAVTIAEETGVHVNVLACLPLSNAIPGTNGTMIGGLGQLSCQCFANLVPNEALQLTGAALRLSEA